jgi:hypothetical protein
MIVSVSTEGDLEALENKVREALGAQRFDVSVLRSKPYIDMRRTLLCLLGGGHVTNLPGGFYFHKEDLVLRILQREPLLVWVGFRDGDIYGEEDSI